MNIILIGPDGAGKSTIAQALGDELRYAVLHTQWEMFGRDGILDAYDFESDLLSKDNHLIFDRHTAIESAVYRKHFAYEVPIPSTRDYDVLGLPHNLIVVLTYDKEDVMARKGDDEHIHMIETVRSEFLSTLALEPLHPNTRMKIINTSGRIATDVAKEIVSFIPKESLTKAPDRGFSKDADNLLRCPNCASVNGFETERRPDGDTTCMRCKYKGKTTEFDARVKYD